MAQQESPAVRLKDALEASGISARRLSRLLAQDSGADPESVRRSISRWLKGQPISNQYATLLAKHLGQPAGYFRTERTELRTEVAELRAELEQVRAKVAQLEQAQAENLKQRSPGQGSRGASQA